MYSRRLATTAAACLGLLACSAAPATAPDGAPAGIFAFGWGANFQDTDVFSLEHVDGMTAYFAWSDLEPRPDDYRFETIETLLAEARRTGKLLNIGVYPGSHAPAWVYDAGAESFSWVRTLKEDQARRRGRLQPQTAPLPWDEVFLTQWEDFVAELARRFGDDPNVGYVALTGPTMRDLSTGLLLREDTTWDRFVAAGYTEERVIGAWRRIIDHYHQQFGDRPLVLALGPLRPGSPDVTIASAVAAHVREREYRNIAFMAVFLNDTWFRTGLGARRIREILRSAHGEGYSFGYQMAQAASRNATWRETEPIVNDLGASLRIGIDDGASWIEVWHDDLITARGPERGQPNEMHRPAITEAHRTLTERPVAN